MGKPKNKYGYTSALAWWGSLSIEEKVKYKRCFINFKEKPETKRNNYPNMYNIEHLRLSQLAHKHIYRIWVFKRYY